MAIDYQVDAPNGMAIDALSMVSRQLSVNFVYRVMPTRRGAYSLGNGLVDSFIAISHNEKMEKQGLFPMRDGRVDKNRALMTWDLAAFQRKGKRKADSSGFKSPITVPPGFDIENMTELRGLETHVIGSLERQLDMLLRGHTNTALADALHAGYLIEARPEFAGKIQKVSDSVSTESSYLMLSKDFYRQYPDFSELLWNRLSEVRESAELWDGVDRYFR